MPILPGIGELADGVEGGIHKLTVLTRFGSVTLEAAGTRQLRRGNAEPARH